MNSIKDHPLYRIHNIDSAMSSMWEFYKGRFVALFLISLVMSGITQYATLLIDLKSLQTVTDPAVMIEKLKGMMLPLSAIMVVSLLFNTILHYYILHKPLDSTQNFFVCLVRSLRYFIPNLIIMIIFAFIAAIAIVLGVFALIVGAFFAAVWAMMVSCFILPVMMAEEADMGTTVRRTVKLAHANFWPNMGWTTVFLILFFVVSLVLSGLVLLPFAGSFIKTVANPQDTTFIKSIPTDPIFLLLSSAVNALTTPLVPIFAYILYFNARAREDAVNIITEQVPGSERVRVEDLYAKPREENKFDNN
jgi:hypothetical protein